MLTLSCADGVAPASSRRLVVRRATPTVQSTGATAIPGEFLVVLRPGSDDVASEARFVATIGGQVTATWVHALRGFAATLSGPQRDAVARRPAVEFIEANSVVHAAASRPCAPYAMCSWGLDRIDETNLPMDGLFVTPAKNGAGVHAYVIDTGIRITHADFAGRASYGIDLVDGDAIADDCNGHGTSMASRSNRH